MTDRVSLSTEPLQRVDSATVQHMQSGRDNSNREPLLRTAPGVKHPETSAPNGERGLADERSSGGTPAAALNGGAAANLARYVAVGNGYSAPDATQAEEASGASGGPVRMPSSSDIRVDVASGRSHGRPTADGTATNGLAGTSGAVGSERSSLIGSSSDGVPLDIEEVSAAHLRPCHSAGDFPLTWDHID